MAYPLYFNPDYSVIDRSFRRLVDHADSWQELVFSMVSPTRRVMLTPSVNHPHLEGIIISYWEGFHDIAFTKIPLTHIHERFPGIAPLLPHEDPLQYDHARPPLSPEHALELACSCALSHDGIVTLSCGAPSNIPRLSMLLELHPHSRAPIRREYLVTYYP